MKNQNENKGTKMNIFKFPEHAQENENLDDSLERDLKGFIDVPKSDFDFMKANNEKIFSFIDIDNEQIKASHSSTGEESEELELNVVEGTHPLLIPEYPICVDHTILPLFVEQQLPQILSDDLLLLIIQSFLVFKDLNIKSF